MACFLTNVCPSVEVLSIVGTRSNKSKKLSAADIDAPIVNDLLRREYAAQRDRKVISSYRLPTDRIACIEKTANANTL